ncbi:MAG: MerR family transcriptional regulator [Dehalococcoidia bacterium]|nr:MerR family transcriptional regulator [Dehalococcoidia bacterium]
MRQEESEPLYVISIVARIIGVGTHTLRYYERMGLLEPTRSQGNRRLYSYKDVERLRHIKTLMEDLGVNLAGVEVILRLTQRLTELEERTNELETHLRELTGAGLLPAERSDS